MKNLNFEELRKELLKECYDWSDPPIVTFDFRKSFFKLIEYCVFSLIEQKESFFAHFIIQLKREIHLQLSTALVSKATGAYYTLYFNPSIFLTCSIEEMKALLKHEVYHIISLHHIRAKSILKLYSEKAVNIAMDISVNQYILNLPVWSEKLENISLSYNVGLKEEQTIEEYARIIQDAMNRMKSDEQSKLNGEKLPKSKGEDNSSKIIIHDIEKTHELWKYGDLEIDDTQIKEIVKKLVNSSIRGKAPESIEKLIASLHAKPEINWTNYLKKLLGTFPYGSKKTVTRRDRRQPERLDLRGRLNKQIINIVVAIDISGSMSDKEIEKIMVEIFSIVKNYKHKLSIMECDNEIRRVYTVSKLKDLKQKVNTRGGTRFSPVFEYMNKNFSKDSLLVYFTDGIGERELNVGNIHRRVLWVLTGEEENLSLLNPPGIIKKLSNERKKESNVLAIEYLKNELKDIRSEWAK